MIKEKFISYFQKIYKGIFALLCLISILFILSLPIKGNAFEKKDIQYLDMLKAYKDSISLQFPINIYISQNGEIHIVDSGLSMILIFDENFLPLSVIDKTHGLKHPISVAVDNEGIIYVSEEISGEKHKGEIAVFDFIGRKKKRIKFEGFPDAEGFLARDMAFDEKGNLYLAGGSSCRLVILSADGKLIRTIEPIEKSSNGAEIKVDVAGVSVKENFIYLLSEWQGHVYVYNSKGEKISVFGKKGGSPGKLSRAQGLAIDPIDGTSYVIDYMRHTILIYDLEGHFIGEFGGEGCKPGWFSYPKDVCIDSRGRLFIADTFNKRVQVFQIKLENKNMDKD